MDKETLLINRIHRNFADYKAKLLKVDGEGIFEKAEEIAAYTQVHWYLTVDHHYEPEELDYLLLFQNPLGVVADQYQNELRCVNDVLELIVRAGNKQDGLGDYPLMKKHGEPER
ncbi:MAG: hypothetical protein ACOX47_03860 [Bacillota bacterium]